ncbi:MAG: hypothetical protein OYK82_11815 [Gammaproteobacteria bacterium]|nr:hypothetical protein [Gammaproteobacteria bacterium]
MNRRLSPVAEAAALEGSVLGSGSPSRETREPRSVPARLNLKHVLVRVTTVVGSVVTDIANVE